MQNAHPAYRSDIDGLRAIAILSVVVYHAFPVHMRGGFIGVDVFFVISGYLISSILFKSLERGDFNFAEFYARRVRRIFPALIVVLMLTYLAGWFLLLPDEFKQLGKHMAAGAGFVQNVVLNREAGYFDTASELKPLMHLWSLSVEEQFYLIAPVVIWAGWRVGLNVLNLVLLAAFISFGINIADIADHPTRVFFLPQTRVWELLAGSVMAYMHVFRKDALASVLNNALFHSLLFSRPPAPDRRVAVTSDVLAVIGILLILGAAFGLANGRSYPGGWAVIPVTGACLLIVAGPGAWLSRKVLSSRVMVYIGLISYPLYLWHWPVLSFVRIQIADSPSNLAIVGAVAASFALAALTYRWVELPLRAWNRMRIKTCLLVALMVVLGYLGYNAYVRDGLGFRLKDRQAFAQYFENNPPALRYATEHQILRNFRDECDFFDTTAWREGRGTVVPRNSIDPSCYTPTKTKSVFIWGDSHAQQLNPGLKAKLPSDVSLLQVATSACAPQIGSRLDTETEFCKTSNRFAIDAIKKSVPDVVVLAQATGHDEKNDLVAIAALLKSFGVGAVIVAGPVPKWDPFLYKAIVKNLWVFTPRRTFQNVVRSTLQDDARLTRKYASGAGGFKYLSMIDLLCKSDGCLTYIGNDRREGIVTFDYGHLSLTASSYVAENLLVPEILTALQKPR